MKIGSIIQWASNTIPDGWLLCDGSAVSRTTYADLFSIIGTTYGAGDGSTTFNVPNYKGRVGVGLDSNDTDFDTLGETLGEKTHTLTIDEMPSHTHDIQPKANAGWRVGDTSGIGGQHSYDNVLNTQAVFSQPHNSTLYVAGATGGGQAHNIIQPSIVTNYIIKALNPDSIKISELESASNVTSSDVLPIVQNGETKKVSTETLLSDIYSTNEVKTNKVWIDGKPIYRKVITGELGTNTNHGLTNFNIVNMSGLYIGSSNNAFNLPSVRPNFTDYEVGFYVSSTQIVFEKPSGGATGTFYIILEYTKTTE